MSEPLTVKSPAKSLYNVGDIVEIRSEVVSGRVLYDYMTWKVVRVMEQRDKWRKRYALYVLEGTWIEKTNRGGRSGKSINKKRTTYRQYRASRLRAVK